MRTLQPVGFIIAILLSGWGLYLFIVGFLLTRVELDTKNSVELMKTSNPDFFSKYGSILFPNSSNSEANDHQIKHIVLFLIDAERFDFSFPKSEKNTKCMTKSPQSSLQDPEFFKDCGKNETFYIPLYDKLLFSSPESNMLFKFVADPPTTTSQRLKGMTTGSLPTFIDAGKNFNSENVNEDNLLFQITHQTVNKQQFVVLGDDTWGSLYPPQENFARARLFNSFNVADLDSVDNGVKKYLPAELKNIILKNPSSFFSLNCSFYHFLKVCRQKFRFFEGSLCNTHERRRKIGSNNQFFAI